MMLSLREMQMAAECEFTVEKTRSDLNDIAGYFRNKEWHQAAINAFIVELRKLPAEIAEKQKCFFINEGFTVAELPDEWQTEALGVVRNKHVTHEGRFVYPVMDVRGDIMGFCSWEPYSQPKYLDSKNHGYIAKRTTLFGMEELPRYYISSEPVYVVEGIVCCLYLRSKGLQSLALLGSMMSPYVVQILKRFGSRLCVVPDNDAFGKDIVQMKELAGEHLVKSVKRMLQKAIICQSTVAKDIDDSRLAGSGMYERDLLADLRQVMMNPWLPLKTLRVR